MVDETVRFDVAGAFLGVDVDVFGVGAQDQFGPVGVEGEGDDWAGDQLVDLGSWHGDVKSGTRDRKAVDRLFVQEALGWIVTSLISLLLQSRPGDRWWSGVKRSGGQPPVLSVKDFDQINRSHMKTRHRPLLI